MEFQRKYDQIVYNICQLIHKDKYKRAIATAEYLQTLGLANHEVLVLKSYATSKLEGCKKALDMLQFLDGPLVSVAKAQYNQQLLHFEEAQASFKNLVVQGKKSIVDFLAKSNQICISGEGELQGQAEVKKMRLVTDKREEECLKAINKISQEYRQTKSRRDEGSMHGEQFSKVCEALVQKYESVLNEHRPRKELKQVIEHFITYLSNL